MECLVKQTHRLPRLCFDAQRCALVTAGADFNADAFVSECRARASLETLLRDLAVFGGAAHAALLDALNTHFAAFNGLSATLAQHTQRLAPVQHSVGELLARIDAWLAALEKLEAQHSELHARAAEATRLRVIAQTLRSALATTQKLERALDVGARHGGYPYAAFFHAKGHGALHDRLSLAMCEAVRPHLRSALEADAAERGVPAADADTLAAIMLYACVGLASGQGMPDEATLATARRYLRALLDEFRKGSSTD